MRFATAIRGYDSRLERRGVDWQGCHESYAEAGPRSCEPGERNTVTTKSSLETQRGRGKVGAVRALMLAWCGTSVVAAAAGLRLAEEGRRPYRIVVSAQASASERYAAECASQ